MSYFERPLPIALIFGSFFAIFVPLVLLQLFAASAAWLPLVLMVQAVGLGTSHFFVTLAVYLQSANLDYFASTARNRLIYFALPVLVFLFFALSEASRFRETQPALAAGVFGVVRFLDFFHVGRQSVGMLQIWKRGLPGALPAWSRNAENAFFVGMAALQWLTFARGGHFAADVWFVVLPAVALALLFVWIAAAHVRAALREQATPRRFLPLSYFAMQAVCSAAAVYETRLYLVALTLHYVEYHVIMMPRCLHAPLSPARRVDRLALGLRSHAALFYGALAAVVVLFELRQRVPVDVAPSTAFFVHLFDGIFVVHYVIEAFLWKFGNPYYRAALAPLYFAPWPPSADAAAERAAAPVTTAAVVSADEAAPDAPAPAEALQSAPAARRAVVVLCAALFTSGAAALIFETLWFRQAGLGFGNSVWASSLVLSAFMGGMGLGNWLAARHGDRLRDVVRAYAGLELLTAASGVALVYLLPVCGDWLAPLARAADAAPAQLNLARLGVAFALLAIPSTAMGMTLPLLVRAARGYGASFGRVLGLLYGVNTAGAVLGVVATEGVLLGALGIRGTGWVAAGLGVVAALVVLGFARDGTPAPGDTGVDPPASGPEAATARSAALPWLIAAFGAGFALLALEVVWLRFAMLFLNDTPLAFAVMLATVLAGIALGGLLAAVLAGMTPQPSRFAPLAASAAGIAGVAGYRFYPSILSSFYTPAQDGWAVFTLVAPLVLPASLASGLLFALLGDGLRRVAHGDARTTGWLAFGNTLGAGLGSLVAGFVLLPRAGMERTLFALFAVYGLVAAVLALERGLRPALRFGGVVALGGALLAFPFGVMRADFVRLSAERWMSSGDRIAGVREGLTGTLVHVVHGVSDLPLFDQLATNAYSMSVNDFAGRRYMDLFGVLPRALHPRMQDALIVGYGIGNTAAAIAADPELERIDLVDISADILALGRRVQTRSGRHPLSDPRLRVHIEDGRYFLQTTERRYDLITGEPPPPIMAGVVNLYTAEYFALVRSRLTEGGIASYWLPIMNLSAATTKSLIRGFCAAFPDCSLWHGSARNFMLLGTRDAGRGGPVSAERFARAFDDPAFQDELVATGLELPAQLGALFVGDSEYLNELTADAEPLTDDRPMRMHQHGTREDRDALAWQWRDTTAARARFERSALVARLFPEPIRREALRQFENQRLLNDLLFPGDTAARQMRVVHQVLHGTRLRLPVLLLLGSDPDIQRALARAPQGVRERDEWLVHRAVGALAERDYGAALELLERAPDDQLPLPDLRDYVRYVIKRATQGPVTQGPVTQGP